MPDRVCRPFILLFVAAVLIPACSKPKTPVVAVSPAPSAAPASSVVSTTAGSGDFACKLLTPDEAQAVQGEPFKNTKPSERVAAGLIVSQCYYETPTPVNSIVVTVTRKAEGGRDPSASWREIFHREELARKKEEEEKETKPLQVTGLGDEAFWTGTRIGGALYVLKGNCYVRISVGGAGDQEQKIERTKKIAESVLRRL